mgnify:CR=1 FL=1
MLALLFVLALAGVAYAMADHYPKGHGPLDVLPPGLGTRSATSKVTAPTTKIVYETWTYPPAADGKQFHVAVRADGHLGWVEYWMDRVSKARTFYAGWTPEQGDQLALLRKDFGV